MKPFSVPWAPLKGSMKGMSLLLHCQPNLAPWQLCDVKVLKEKPSFGHLFINLGNGCGIASNNM